MGSRLDITCNILVVGLRRSWKCVLTDTISVSTATFNSPWPLADSTCNIKQELSLKKNYHWRRTITEEELSLKKNYHWRRTITEEDEIPLPTYCLNTGHEHLCEWFLLLCTTLLERNNYYMTVIILYEFEPNPPFIECRVVHTY